jgi:hypothetical protein
LSPKRISSSATASFCSPRAPHRARSGAAGASTCRYCRRS